jgi:hypothetical protein
MIETQAFETFLPSWRCPFCEGMPFREQARKSRVYQGHWMSYLFSFGFLETCCHSSRPDFVGIQMRCEPWYYFCSSAEIIPVLRNSPHYMKLAGKTRLPERFRDVGGSGFETHNNSMRSLKSHRAPERLFNRMHTNFPNTTISIEILWDFRFFWKRPSACLQWFWEFEESDRGIL